MNQFDIMETIDAYEFPVYQIYWTLDEKSAYKIRPFIKLEDSNYVGYLDDLSKTEKPKSEKILTTEMILEALYRLTSSERQREILVDFDIKISNNDKFLRFEILEIVELYEKFAKKYANDQMLQNKLFNINSIDDRQNKLTKISINNQDIYWHVIKDDSSTIRPFLKLQNNKVGYLDNCVIDKMPEASDIITCHNLADLLMSLRPANLQKANILDSMYNQLNNPERLSQKALARISQIYHETAQKYVIKQTILNKTFGNN